MVGLCYFSNGLIPTFAYRRQVGGGCDEQRCHRRVCPQSIAQNAGPFVMSGELNLDAGCAYDALALHCQLDKTAHEGNIQGLRFLFERSCDRLVVRVCVCVCARVGGW